MDPTFDEDLYSPGLTRVAQMTAAWLHGIRRHQIREVEFVALAAGAEFGFHVHIHSDGKVVSRASLGGEVVWVHKEPRPVPSSGEERHG